MIQNKNWQKPFRMRLGQSLWASILRWSEASGWPLESILLRLLMLPLFPLYCLRLGLNQGSRTFYRFFFGAGGFTVYRSERDPGCAIRVDNTDAWVFQQIFILRTYQQLSRRANVRVIIDAGAHVGFTAIYFAELYPHAFIYALEPEEGNFQALLRNTRYYPNIKAIQAALWKDDSDLEIKDIRGNQCSYVVKPSDSKSSQLIPAITLQNLIEQYRLPKIDILKMDIEGSESSIFEGSACHQWLPYLRVLAIDLHEHLFVGSDRNFFEAIKPYPYTVGCAGKNIIFDFHAAEQLGLDPGLDRKLS